MAGNSVDAFQMQSQRPYDRLCWAAVALSVDKWHNPGSIQTLCQVVQNTPVPPGIPPPAGCCSSLSSPSCNHVSLLLPALQTLGLAIAGFVTENGPRPANMDQKWNEIKGEIDAGRVLCAGFTWKQGSKHYAVIWAYDESGGSRTLSVLDPWFAPTSGIPYDQFVKKYQGSGQWSDIDKVI
jgi:hypothetical protein